MSSRARCGPPSRIRGSLAIVQALAVLLGAQLCIVWVFSSAGFRQYERVSANVRAIYLAERVFSQTMARSKARPWSGRWFRGEAVTEKSVALERGSYSSYVTTVPHPDKKLADGQGAALSTVVGYMRSVTAAKATSLGGPGPDPALVDPPVTSAGRTNPFSEQRAAERAVTAYARWWSLTGGLGGGQISWGWR